MKFKHNVKLIDKSNNKKIVNNNKKYILESIMSIMDKTFDFDMELDLIITEINENIKFVKDEYVNGYSTIKNEKFTIVINFDVIKNIENDNGLDFSITIIHELGHIYDIYHTLNNKYYNANPLKTRQKTYFDFIVSQGYSVWTEFFAYYFTFKYFKNYDYPTFLDLVKAYENLENYHKKINAFPSNQIEEKQNMIDEFVNNIKEFLYCTAKYIAGMVKGTRKYYKYCDKTTSKKSFQKVEHLCNGLLNRIYKFFSNTHGKGLKNKLYNLGDYIIKNIYVKFYIFPKKLRKYVYFAFYEEIE